MFYAKRLMEGFFNYQDVEAGSPIEAGSPVEAGSPIEAGSPVEAGSPIEAGSPVVAGLSISFLNDLKYRIDQEILALTNLNIDGTNANITAKINQLSLMSNDVSILIDKLVTNQIALEDIPFTRAAADAFLASLGSPSNSNTSYPSLFNTGSPSPAQAPTVASGGAGGAGAGGGGVQFTDLQSMFANVQDAKWRYELSYDPTYTQKTNLLDRLIALENRIMTYAKSDTPIPDDVKKVLTAELQLLTNIIMGTKTIENTTTHKNGVSSADDSYKPRIQSENTRFGDNSSSYGTYVSDPSRIYSIPTKHMGAGFSLFASSDNSNPDAMVRPGFIMTEDQIRHRGSTAAFNTQAVGGADYKKRSEELCRQIRGANIGAPVDFGCIENPSEVSASYSWKGNYEMVCNRLGDTWGSWYPQMFGCPTYDPVNEYNGKLL